MRIVVSGTHGSGKSTLISDFVGVHPEFAVLDDPYELIDDPDAAGVSSFVAQFRVASARLHQLPPGASVIAERGPLDFLAYLVALDELGRADTTDLVRLAATPAARAMRCVDVLVVLPPDATAVGDDEDPTLRAAMAQALLELIDDPDLTGTAQVYELSGPPQHRLTLLHGLLASSP